METDGFIISKFNNNFVSDIHIVVDEIIKIDVYKIIEKMKLRLNADIYIPCTLTFKKYSEIIASKFFPFQRRKGKNGSVCLYARVREIRNRVPIVHQFYE